MTTELDINKVANYVVGVILGAKVAIGLPVNSLLNQEEMLKDVLKDLNEYCRKESP